MAGKHVKKSQKHVFLLLKHVKARLYDEMSVGYHFTFPGVLTVYRVSAIILSPSSFIPRELFLPKSGV
jgi:hypothetical protein